MLEARDQGAIGARDDEKDARQNAGLRILGRIGDSDPGQHSYTSAKEDAKDDAGASAEVDAVIHDALVNVLLGEGAIAIRLAIAGQAVC